MSRRLLTVDHHVPSVLDVPLDLLQRQGIRALLFDLDNTITVWRGMEVDEAVVRWIKALPAAGFSACIVSNSFPARVAPVAQLLDIPYVCLAKKPGVHGLRRACALLGAEPHQTAMIGDQLFTDMLGANRCGLTTVLVDIIDPHEYWGTHHISRRAERLYLKLKK